MWSANLEAGKVEASSAYADAVDINFIIAKQRSRDPQRGRQQTVAIKKTLHLHIDRTHRSVVEKGPPAIGFLVRDINGLVIDRDAVGTRTRHDSARHTAALIDADFPTCYLCHLIGSILRRACPRPM
jgi:hypothetical protein